MASRLNLDLGAPKKSAVSLVISGGNEKLLSKEQKRFNSIVKRIKKARAELAREQAAREELQTKHMPRLLEAEKASVVARRELVVAAHASPDRRRLSKKDAKKLATIMLDEVCELLATNIYRNDAELKGLFQAYDPQKASYDKVREEEEDKQRRMAASLFGNVFDVDVSPDDLDDEARMKEHFQEIRQDMEAAARSQPAKKRSKKQSAAQAAREEAEKALHKTTRQIYLDLVKHYHPDREQDETARKEKTEWMKQITAAYEAEDHLRLLELQMTLLSERENAYSGFDDSHLKVFNQTLQRQLRELEMELHFSDMGGPMDQFMHSNPKIMRSQVDAYVRDMEKDAEKSLKHAAAFVSDEAALRHWIRNYVIENDFGEMDFGAPPFHPGDIPF